MGIINRQRSLDFDWTHVTEHVRSQYLLALGNRREEALYLSPAHQLQRERTDGTHCSHPSQGLWSLEKETVAQAH